MNKYNLIKNNLKIKNPFEQSDKFDKKCEKKLNKTLSGRPTKSDNLKIKFKKVKIKILKLFRQHFKTMIH